MSDYKCDQCGKFKEADVSKVTVGDKVSFAVVTQRSRNSYRFSSKEGQVIAVNGDELTIKVKRGGTYTQQREAVTPEGAPGALTYALFGQCQCGGKAA
jgi:hypothetical protein